MLAVAREVKGVSACGKISLTEVQAVVSFSTWKKASAAGGNSDLKHLVDAEFQGEREENQETCLSPLFCYLILNTFGDTHFTFS